MERRSGRRYPVAGDIESPSSERHAQEGGELPRIQGKVLNLSAGGACVTGDRSVEPFTILPCRFRFQKVPVPVPVLAQVRWVQPVPSQENTFRVGLLFIT